MNFKPSGIMLVEDVDCPDCKGSGYADGYVPTFEQKPYRICATCQGVKVRHRLVSLEDFVKIIVPIVFTETSVDGTRTVIDFAPKVAAESHPEHPDPPMPKRINYRCSKCGVAEQSGELPPEPALRVYPLPPGWQLVPCPSLEEDDHLHCAVCVEQEQS